ncbi:MAG: hypothetical protein M3Y17_08790 [Actinomycetota bacterium]|nr:hypothetical protein [Actinomycetota bacterium]
MTEQSSLRQRQRQPAHIHFNYSDASAGARITCTTPDPVLRQALHTWFAAQLHDHGADAMP